MSYNFTFKVLNVNKEGKTMEVLYESSGRSPIRVFVPMPSEGQSPREVIIAYSPVNIWREMERKVSDVPVGLEGSVSGEEVFGG